MRVLTARRPLPTSTGARRAARTPPRAAAAFFADPPTGELKAQLLDSLYGTGRGLDASSEVRVRGSA